MRIGLYMGNNGAVGSIRWANFSVVVPTSQYPTTGSFVSSVYDCGQTTPTWGTLSWAATLPGSTAVQFQLASSNSVNGPWTYLGPTGAASFYTTSGTSIPSVGAGAQTGRYMKYQATLTGPGTATPELTQVSVTFAGTNPSTRYGYAYDSRGNMTGITTQVAAGTATEVRTHNDLNELLTNAVTPVGGGTTNWTYTYNLDGTLATKFDGTNTYAYTWDPGGDQRLLSMALNGVTQVAFTYDSSGRMLTRTPYSAGVAGTPTNFEWQGTTVVREFAPAGTYRYYAPQDELITFDYTPTAGATSTYCLHLDALGSVRMITDSTGASVAHYEFDAFGNLLASSSDISFGFNYRYVGSLGVRWDATLGMYYMLNRFYDPTLQRFISRDQERSNNRYEYAANNPANLIDSTGLAPETPTGGNQLGDSGIYRIDGSPNTYHNYGDMSHYRVGGPDGSPSGGSGKGAGSMSHSPGDFAWPMMEGVPGGGSGQGPRAMSHGPGDFAWPMMEGVPGGGSGMGRGGHGSPADTAWPIIEGPPGGGSGWGWGSGGKGRRLPIHKPKPRPTPKGSSSLCNPITFQKCFRKRLIPLILSAGIGTRSPSLGLILYIVIFLACLQESAEWDNWQPIPPRSR